MVPEGWEIKSIGDVCEVKGGKRLPKGRSLQKRNTPYPYIRVSDMFDGGVSLEDIRYVPEDVAPSIARYTISKNDLFISVAGTLGLVGKVPKELDGANLTENADKLTKIQTDKDYLLAVLQSPWVQKSVENEKTSNAQPKLALERIRGFRIPVPPLAEQRKIAEILSTWDRAIEVAEAQLSAAHSAKRALMQQLLTGKRRFPEFEGEEWKEVRLGDVCAPKQWPTIGKNDMTESGYPVFGANGFIGFYSEFNHEHPTTVVTCRGATCGTVSRTPPSTYITGNAMSLDYIDFTRVDDEFLFFALQRRGFDDIISGSAQPQIIGKDIRSVKLNLPNLGEQKKIAGTLSVCDSDVANIEAQITKLRTEKKALMQQLLTGKRRVVV